MPENNHITEILANERTFLAWIRTSIAVMSLGFVVAKFGVWLRELGLQIDPKMPEKCSGMSMPIGIVMMAVGGILAILAARHYHLINQAIERGDPYVGRRLINGVTIVVVLLAILMIAYMLTTSKQF